MKLHVLSDLHLNVGDFEAPDTAADVVVLAGDIARPDRACAWARGLGKPVVYVAGNHEFYGASIEGRLREIRSLCASSQVHFLEADELRIDGVRFLGTTLWTDFALFGDGQQLQAMQQAGSLMRDFSAIRCAKSPEKFFSPEDSVALFTSAKTWLASRLLEPFDGATVVVTHHAPSPRSVHPRFVGSLLNAAFVSDAEQLLGADRVGLWIHGHTHDSFDYEVAGTRVVCNPRGYAKHGVNENSAFDASLIITV